MAKKDELLYEFWRIYDTTGIKDALLYLDNNNYYNNIYHNISCDTTENSHYDNYTNELTTENALNSMLSSLTLNL